MKIGIKNRSEFLQFLTHRLALPVLTVLRRRPPFPYSHADLMRLPEGSLGRELAEYLSRNGFSLLPGYERHDCKHIILRYEMDEKGEACMQFHLLGAGHYSLTVIITVVMCSFLMPEYYKAFVSSFRKGRSGVAFRNADFALMVSRPTDELRKFYNTL